MTPGSETRTFPGGSSRPHRSGDTGHCRWASGHSPITRSCGHGCGDGTHADSREEGRAWPWTEATRMMGDGVPGEQKTKMSSGDSCIPQPPGASVLLSEEGGGCSETEFSSLSVKMSEEDQPSRISLERHLPRRLMAPLCSCPREGGKSCPSPEPLPGPQYQPAVPPWVTASGLQAPRMPSSTHTEVLACHWVMNLPSGVEKLPEPGDPRP